MMQNRSQNNTKESVLCYIWKTTYITLNSILATFQNIPSDLSNVIHTYKTTIFHKKKLKCNLSNIQSTTHSKILIATYQMNYNLTETRPRRKNKEEDLHREIKMTDSSPSSLSSSSASPNSSKSHIDQTIVNLLADEQQGVEKVEVIKNLRQNFIDLAVVSCKGHTRAANFYNVLFIMLNLMLTLLTAFATVLSTQKLPGIDDSAVPIITGLATIISTVIGFLKPADRRNKQLQFAKEIKVLMFRMIECESQETYDEIWKEFYGVMMTEPLLKRRYRVQVNEAMAKMKWPLKAKFKNDLLVQHGLSVVNNINTSTAASSPLKDNQVIDVNTTGGGNNDGGIPTKNGSAVVNK